MSKEQEKLDQNIKENWLSAVGVRKPYTVFVCIVAIIILGVFAFTSMSIDLFPNLSLPVAIVYVTPNTNDLLDRSKTVELEGVPGFTGTYYDYVSAGMPGAPTAQIEQAAMMTYLQSVADAETIDTITNKVINALSVVNGVKEVQSTTMTAVGMLMFQVKYSSSKAVINTTDLHLAVVGVTENANCGYRFMTPRIIPADPAVLPIMSVTVKHTDATLTDAWFQENVVDKLQAVDGVAQTTSNIVTDAALATGDAAWIANDGALVKTYSISIRKDSNSTTTDVAAKVVDALENIKRKINKETPGFDYSITSSQAEYINQSIGSVGENLIVGAILAIIILFLFLRSFKMTLAIGISIPLALVGTFVAMYFMGIGLNIVSMSGLALAVGMLVDNSVVVLENIYRLRNKGLPIKDAAIKGASQIMLAMLASSLTTICVFFPMFFLEGMLMEVFTDLIWVVILSLACSFIVAVMFLPSIVATFKIQPKAEKVLAADEKPSKWQQFKAKCSAAFDRTLNFCIDKKWLTIALAFVLFVGSIGLAFTHGFILMPEGDEGNFTINAVFKDEINADPVKNAAYLDETGKCTTYAQPLYDQITAILGEDIDQCVVQYVSGRNQMDILQGTPQSMQVSIQLRDRRKITTQEASEKVLLALQKAADSPYKTITTSSASMTQGMVATDVSVSVTTNATDVYTAWQYLDDFNTTLDSYFTADLRAELKIDRVEYTLSNLSGRGTNAVLTKVGNKNSTTFTIKALSGADTAKIQSKLDEFVAQIKTDVPQAGFVELDDGLAAQLKDTYTSMAIALAVGFILIYLVMVAIFQSFLMPFIILICVPLGFTGAFLLLAVCQMPLSLPALIGLLVLMGVVINNGILAVDYTNQARRDGLNVKDALVAAMRTRMRPIFMTALTTILALVPMALGISIFNPGGSTALMQPLAVVSIGGLLFGTITTLLVVPAFYAIFCRDKKDKASAAKKTESTVTPTPVK